jgi:AAA family ATP:ADP antiporter
MTTPGSKDSQAAPFSSLERFLRIFSDIRTGEGPAGLLLMANIFLVLAAYYFIKPVREGWLSISDVGQLSKMEIKAYSSLGQSLVLFVVMPLYGYFTSYVSRLVLIVSTTIFLMSNMLAFWLLRPGFFSFSVPHIGIVFYLWVGIFSVTLVAQFWAFAADLYDNVKGKRLFPLIAIGASAGASAGAWMTERIVKAGIVDTYDLILIAIVPLAAALVLSWFADRQSLNHAGQNSKPLEKKKPPAADDHRSSYQIVFSYRYLIALAMLALLINWVNSNGENILYGAVQEALRAEYISQGMSDPAAITSFIKQETTAFYGNLYFWTNLVGLFLQAFVVSRLLKYGGVATVLLLTPFIALLSYGLMAVFPVLALIRIMKIAENSSNYSVNNTARHVLWLPVPSALLYKAKSTIDTFFVRLGDGLAALTIMVGTQVYALHVKNFLLFNTLLAFIWVLLAFFVARENQKAREQFKKTDAVVENLTEKNKEQV